MKRQVNFLKRTFLTNNYFSQKGQALVELAIFGTILLFCLAMLVNFGLQANYQQEVEMKAFRQAMKQSYNNDSKGPNAGSEVNLIEDKVGISTQDAYGVSERYPFGSFAKVTWNNNIMDEYVDSHNNLNLNYRPTASYHINGQEYGPYTTADFRTYNCVGIIKVRVPRINGRNGKYWEDVNVACGSQTKVFEEEMPDHTKLKVGYVLIEGEREQLSSADVDGDGKQELVVKVEGADKGPITSFVVLDSQEGQLDTTVEMKYNSDGSNNLEDYAKRQQGLLPDYTKTITKSGTMTKTEDKAGITTTSNANSKEVIIRTIRLNNGVYTSSLNILSNEKDNIKWTSPK